MSFDDNDVPLSVLGKSLKCDKDDEFGKIVNQKIGNTDVTLYLTCPQCGNKWSNTYNFGQFIRMANMALIDKPQVIEFQKKMVVHKGKYIKLDEGLEGAYYVEPKAEELVKKYGRYLLCKCNHFYSLSIRKLKKDKVYLNGHCPECAARKPEKIKLPVEAVIEMGKAGLIHTDLYLEIKNEYKGTSGFDTSESYSAQDGTLAYHVRERLGMAGDAKRTKCYICGASVSEDADRCPKCGSDLDMEI